MLILLTSLAVIYFFYKVYGVVIFPLSLFV